MSPDPREGLGASLRQRLLNLSRERNASFQRILDRFVLERFLYRLSRSQQASDLVLKGAYALDVWATKPVRPTRDADFGGPPELSRTWLVRTLETACAMEVESDAVSYDPASIRIEEIRAHQAASGYRASIRATLAGARSTVRLDLGLGDAVVPPPESRTLSSLLNLPAPVLKVSPPEAMIAEKIEAMVDLGFANSRMKDFYDIAFLADSLSFESGRLVRAVRATFSRRKTEIPATTPLALTEDFWNDATKEAQWRGFLKAAELDDHHSLAEIGKRVLRFSELPLEAARRVVSIEAHWPPGGPWKLEA